MNQYIIYFFIALIFYYIGFNIGQREGRNEKPKIPIEPVQGPTKIILIGPPRRINLPFDFGDGT